MNHPNFNRKPVHPNGQGFSLKQNEPPSRDKQDAKDAKLVSQSTVAPATLTPATPPMPPQAKAMHKAAATSAGPLRRNHKPQIKSLDQLANMDFSERAYLLPYLVPENATTVFLASADIKFTMLLLMLPYCVASTRPLEPFGAGAGVPVLVCLANLFLPDLELLPMLEAKNTDAEAKKIAQKNLRVHYCDPNGTLPVPIDTGDGQRAILDSMPPDCKLIVFDNISAWVSGGKLDDATTTKVRKFLVELNDEGVSVVIFDSPKGKSADASTLTRNNANVIHLTKDAAAPHEFGGGFNIVRAKHGFADQIPSTIQFWYKVFNQTLNFGWEFRDPNNTQTAKQVAKTQRQMQVDKLLQAGKKQKEIAKILKVDAATISRDLTELQKARAAADASKTSESGSPEEDAG